MSVSSIVSSIVQAPFGEQDIVSQYFGNLVSLWSPSDLSTVTTASHEVSQVDDKSSSGYDLIQDLATKPDQVHSTIRFNKTNDYMYYGSKSAFKFMHADPFTLYVLVKLNAAPNDGGGIFSTIGGASTNVGLGLSYVATNNKFKMNVGNGSAAVIDEESTNDAAVPGTWQVVSLHYDGSTMTMMVDGSQVAQEANLATPSTSDSQTNVFVNFNGTYCGFDLGEILILNRFIDPSSASHTSFYNRALSVRDLIEQKKEERLIAQIGGCQVWRTGARSGTVTADGSNNVSAWSDPRSGYTDAVQATEANQPDYTHPGIVFDGSNDSLVIGSAGDYNIHDGTGWTVITATNIDSGYSGSGTVTFLDTGGANVTSTGDAGVQLLYLDSTSTHRVIAGNGSALTAAYSGTASSYTKGSINVDTWYVDDAGASDFIVYNTAGTQVIAQNKANAFVENNSEEALTLGLHAATASTHPMDGPIQYLLIFNKTLTTTEANWLREVIGSVLGVSVTDI